MKNFAKWLPGGYPQNANSLEMSSSGTGSFGPRANDPSVHHSFSVVNRPEKRTENTAQRLSGYLSGYPLAFPQGTKGCRVSTQ